METIPRDRYDNSNTAHKGEYLTYKEWKLVVPLLSFFYLNLVSTLPIRNGNKFLQDLY